MSQSHKKAKLLEKAQTINTGCGIYRMLDVNNRIIYIGKARNLRSRICSYFQKDSNDNKTKVLTSRTSDFDVILTDSEAEALILESILIKKNKPRYNVMLKDDKSYPYLIIDFHHNFPKLTFARRFKRKKDTLIFGPYVSSGALKKAIQFLNHSFQLRECSDIEFVNRSRPCMSHQIGACSAPCTNLISQEDYGKELESALQILRGKGKNILEILNEKMEEYSKKMNYESAANVRDQIKNLEETLSKGEQKITSNTANKLDINDKDIIGFHQKDQTACFSIIFIRNGNIINTSNFFINQINEMETDEIFSNFLGQFYLTGDIATHTSIPLKAKIQLPGIIPKAPPSEILLPMKWKEAALFEKSLHQLGMPSNVVQPKKGIKYELIQMANKNASHALKTEEHKIGNIYKILEEIKSRLRLQNYPRRIECFDVSNLGDKNIVASRATFIEGRPEKKLYRQYKIKSLHSQNDFAAMHEVLSRRLKKSSQYAEKEQEESPDLLIVDGGKGQLSQAMEVIKELEITGIDIIALAKGKVISDFKSTEIEKTSERVFKPGRKNPIVLSPHTSKILQQIRDEAHRFAINFQRKQRKIKSS